MLYANSHNQNLLDHLRAVSQLSEAMALRLGLPKRLIEACRLAGLWHDIGKAIPAFQYYLQTQIGDGLMLIVDDSSEDLRDSDDPRHQEIGWAFVGSKIHNDIVLQAIYWTHARYIRSDHDYYRDRDEILSRLSKEDLAALEEIWPLVSIPNESIPETLEVPTMYQPDGSLNKNTNSEWLLVRGCVVSADRLISALGDTKCTAMAVSGYDFTGLIDSMLTGSMPVGIPACPNGYDETRYTLQTGCAQESKDARTTIVRAPAGFGKTMIGILWSFLRGGRSLWVCPRNAVADAVYDNVVREIQALGLKCSVELYRSGKRQQGYWVEGISDFGADIVITNIDAMLSPMVNNRTAGRMFGFFGANVILDEFHEFVSDSPMFAAFIIYMRARHRVAGNSYTLLLSATPMNVEKMWDITGNETLILPGGGKHYPAAHGKPYQVTFSDSLPGSVDGRKGVLSVCNAVMTSQSLYKLVGGYDLLMHHSFTDVHRKAIEQSIKEWFGKKGAGDKNLVAALVVQAAMDISLRELNDSLCSPESSLQRIGRINRWGKESQALINFINFNPQQEKSEGGAVRVVYDLDLRALWIKHLQDSLDGKTSVTLDELYVIYNTFYDVQGNDVFIYLKDHYKVSLQGPNANRSFLGLIGYYPISTSELKKSMQKKTSAKNLRSPEGGWFFSVYDRDNKTWLAPDDVMSGGSDLYQRFQGEEINRRLLDNSLMKKLLKGLVDSGYEGHQLRVKKGTLPSGIKGWFQMARDPGTPIPDFSRVYDSKLGLVDLRLGNKTGNNL